jgi:ArsR family transcriptional regulator, lead/cadmium/zinc/bismuth-responsive transcriptional repressor
MMEPAVKVVLKPDETAQLAETFGLLADPTRLGIVVACMGDEISTGAIAERLDLSPSLVSHHLRLLKAARMLRAERRGKQVFYTLADACVRDVLATMSRHLFGHDHGGADDDERIDEIR